MAQVVRSATRVFTVLVSKVDLYARCPAEYYATVVQRLPPQALEGKTGALPIRLGNAIHAVLAATIRTVIDGERFPDVWPAIERFFDAVPLLSGSFKAEELPAVREEIAAAVWNAGNMLQRHGLRPLAVEHTLSVARIPVLGLEGKSSPGLFLSLSGRFDLIALEPAAHTLWLPDWKTGHSLSAEEVFPQLPSTTLADFLAKHVYLPRHAELGTPAVKVCHVLTSTGDRVEATLTPDQIESGKTIIRRLAHDLDQGRFLPQLNPFCPWCPVNGACALYSSDESEELDEEF